MFNSLKSSPVFTTAVFRFQVNKMASSSGVGFSYKLLFSSRDTHNTYEDTHEDFGFRNQMSFYRSNEQIMQDLSKMMLNIRQLLKLASVAYVSCDPLSLFHIYLSFFTLFSP